MMLSLALWKAVSDRYQLIFATWDGGRVLENERRADLDADLGSARRRQRPARRPRGLAARGLPALRRAGRAAAHQAGAGARRRRVAPPGSSSCAPSSSGCATRWRSSRPPRATPPSEARRAGRAARARSPSGPSAAPTSAGCSAPLENDATTFERDLIVGNAQRRDARDRAGRRPRAARRPGGARGGAGEAGRASASRTVDPSPHYAVPDVDALGPVPNTPDAITTYLERLDRVGAGARPSPRRSTPTRSPSTPSWSTCSTPTSPRRAASALADGADLAASEQQAREVLARRPAPMAVCRQLVGDVPDLAHPRRPHDNVQVPTARAAPEPIVDGYCDVCGMAPAAAGDPPHRRQHRHRRPPRRRPWPTAPAAPSPAAPARSSTATATSAASAGDSRRAARPRRRSRCPAATLGRHVGEQGAVGGLRLRSGRRTDARHPAYSHRVAADARGPARRRPDRRTRRRRRSTPTKAIIDNPYGARGQAHLLQVRHRDRPRPRRQARPARGLLPAVRPGVLVHAQAARPATSSAGSTRSPAPSRTAASAGSTSPRTATSPTAGWCSRACSTPVTPTRWPRRSPSSSSWPRSSTR